MPKLIQKDSLSILNIHSSIFACRNYVFQEFCSSIETQQKLDLKQSDSQKSVPPI